MASSSRSEDVQFALKRAKTKISNLQQQLSNKSQRDTSSECPVRTSWSTWTPSKELGDSLVDMYSANPRVNVELRQRLPSHSAQPISSPDRSGMSLDHTDCLKDPELLQECSLSPLTNRRSVSPASLLSSRPPRSAGEMEVDLPAIQGHFPWAETCRDVPDREKGLGSPIVQKHLVSTDDSSHQEVVGGPTMASAPVESFDRGKNVSFLLKELDALRDVNKKLLDQLVHKEKELQRREVEEELSEEQREAQVWERPAAVLEEVLASQKERDQALMSRLLLANEERDQAMLHAHQLQQQSELENVRLQDSEMDVDELLQCVCDADSVQDVEHFGSVLVERLRLARQRRHDITAQEMKAVMEERDGSVAKCKRLEQDLVQEREQRASEEELLRLKRERGGALGDRQLQEAELQLLHVNHSSEDHLRPLPLLSSDDISPLGQAPPLAVQLQQLLKEKQSLEAELQRCQETEQEASKRVRRLERLVDVLRKKVGTGSLRAVI